MRNAAPWSIAVVLALAVLSLQPAFAQAPAASRSFLEELAALGFENLALEARPGRITVWYENRVLRHELEAMGMVAATASRAAEPGAIVELIPQNRGVPLLCVAAPAEDWRAFLEGSRTAAAFRERLRVASRREAGEALRIPAGVGIRNRRGWRTDVSLRPLFSFELGVADDPFQFGAWVAPEAVVSPLRGGLVTLQGTVQLRNDMNPYLRTVAPGRNTVSWGGWLPGGALLAASAGMLSGERYGGALEVERLFAGGAIEIEAGADKSGELRFLHDVIVYSPLQAWSAYGAITHRPRGIDLETTVTVARFMERELGGRLDVARRFGEARVGFFGIKTDEDSVIGLETLIPLPVKRWMTPRAIRPVTVAEFPLTYRESVADIGRQARPFDDLDRLRKRLYPSYVWNNLDAMRDGARRGRENDR